MSLLLTLLILLTSATAFGSSSSGPLDKADSLYSADNYRESAKLVEETLASLPKDSEELADAYNLLAMNYFRLGILDRALLFAQNCYEMDMKSGDSDRISSSLNQLACICMASESYREAEKYIQQAIAVEEPLGRPDKLAVRYGNACDIALGLGKIEEALDYATKAYAMDEKRGDEVEMGVRLSQMASCLTKMDMLDEAMNDLQRAEKIFLEYDRKNSLSICYNQMGIIYNEKGQPWKSADYLTRSMELSLETGNTLQRAKTLRYLSSILSAVDSKQAFRLLSEYVNLSDSLHKQKTLNMLDEFFTRNEIIERETLLMKKEKSLRTRGNYIILLLIALILALTAGTIAWRLYKQKERNNEILRKALELKDKLLSIDTSNAPEGVESTIEEIVTDINVNFALDDPFSNLSTRELEVVKYCSEGMVSKEIAQKMDLSPRTVDNHKRNIFRKLGINTTLEMVSLYNKRMSSSDQKDRK